jgi:formyltetrahydrofolate-dependent phosphoribosylglycinamide formyltransferase
VFVGTKGRGSNLFAIHEAIRAGRLTARIVAVIGSRADAPAIQRSLAADLPIQIVDPQRITREEYETELLRVLHTADAGAVALLGYMRRLPSGIVRAFPNRILNVHPALLPLFGGKGMYGEHVHRAALDYGVKVSGCTVHFVDESYDTGPIIAQRAVPVTEDDTPESLAARILPHEHNLLIESLQLLADERLSVEGRVVRVAPAARSSA